MKFTFEIDAEDLWDEGSGRSFSNMVLDEAARQIAMAYRDEMDITVYKSQICKEIDAIVSKNSERIVEEVIERVSDKIARKKRLAAETPKASVIAALDKENEEYFLSMIDKAIAKRFK